MWGAESPHLLKNGVFPQVVEASDWLSVSGGRGAGMKPVRLTRWLQFQGRSVFGDEARGSFHIFERQRQIRLCPSERRLGIRDPCSVTAKIKFRALGVWSQLPQGTIEKMGLIGQIVFSSGG